MENAFGPIPRLASSLIQCPMGDDVIGCFVPVDGIPIL